MKQFPGYFKQVVFVSVAVVDSGSFKGTAEVENLERETRSALEHYVSLSRHLGLPAEFRTATGTEAVEEAEKLCLAVAKEFSITVFFAGKLVFQKEKWYQRILHNETAQAIQQRLQWEGISMVVMPVRVWN